MKPIEDLIGCSSCGSQANRTAEGLECPSCGLRRKVEDRIIFAAAIDQTAVFDALFEQMQIGNQDDETRRFCYEAQAKMAEELLDGRDLVVLDVGCGPGLAYNKPSQTTIVGVDPSLPSLRANKQLDLGIVGSAASLPLRSGVIDIAFCFYSIHHMVGRSQQENRETVAAVFTELRRVVKEGGSIVVFDMSPWYIAWLAQRALWNGAKRVLGPKLDMYFWRKAALMDVASRILQPVKTRTVSFPNSALLTFPPIFSVPWLRIPRFLYPMQPTGYIWTRH